MKELPARASGAEGVALSLAGEVLTLALDRAYAPGAPIVVTLTLEDGELALRLKTIGSKREGERFVVRTRVVDLRRADRERLGALR